jgi:hypothetical protein
MSEDEFIKEIEKMKTSDLITKYIRLRDKTEFGLVPSAEFHATIRKMTMMAEEMRRRKYGEEEK